LKKLLRLLLKKNKRHQRLSLKSSQLMSK
jgi:hypothetical protein